MRPKRLLAGAVALLLLFPLHMFAQDRVISGKVTNIKDGTPITGATVTAKSKTGGATTDANGAFTIRVGADVRTLVISSIGFQDQEVQITAGISTVNITLTEKISDLNEVVVIGYGTRRKGDLTGAVTSINAEDFNKGPQVTPEQLISGKVAGVQITSGGGAPGAGSRIRIRSGASLNASNDPLIVVDGVPLENPKNLDGSSSIAGIANPLSLINPNDIESFNVLKDASATAIYGSRASNGVIIITTKKGAAGKFKVNFNTTLFVSNVSKKVNVLSPGQFRSLVQAEGTPAQIALLGTANTDWQDEIYRSAVASDNIVSLTGGLKNFPYRLSIGYLNQDGVLKTDNMKRISGNLNLSPKFFDNHLSINLNLKGSSSKSFFADQGAIGTAVFFDPTHPVYNDSAKYDAFGGYFEWLDGTGNPNTLAPRNPLSMLEQRENIGNVDRSIGSLQLDYKLHFFPDLRANLNVGYDVSKSDGTNVRFPTLASAYLVEGSSSEYSQKRTSKLFDFYFNYTKDVSSIDSRFDVTAGYSYQDFMRESPSYPTKNGNGSVIAAGNPFKTQNTLLSYFGRLNYTYNDKYLLTATVRRDGSSRFSPDNRWGTFPSAAVAWRVNKENFLETVAFLSDLKLRLGYGVTGQQDIGQDYPYLARYTQSDSSSRYQFGPVFYPTLRPQGYDENIKWEETRTFNVGIDYGFFNGRISGSIDYYFKKTKDLLAVISVPAGSNFTNRILTNVGNIENKGIEFVINATPVRTADFNWDANFNITWNKSTITNLSKILDTTSIGNEVGGIGGGVGNNVQIHSVGYNPYSFYVYQQLYDANGKPLEGLYADVDGNGVLDLKDKYRYKSPEPKVFLGFSSQFSYKKWSLAFTMRAQFGNYMYNNFHSNNGTYANFRYTGYLGNVAGNVLETSFEGSDSRRYWSDYYVENASFLRMDNINIGYNFGQLTKYLALRVSATVQNAFTITKYSGLDPEIAGGIDNNFYPRPRIFSLNANFNLF
jgi:TonB-dependent starch-binding outer membrane protein SusC